MEFTAFLLHAKSVSTLLPKGLKLDFLNGEVLYEADKYRRLIGRFLYINISRPDISFLFIFLVSSCLLLESHIGLLLAMLYDILRPVLLTACIFLLHLLCLISRLIVMQIGLLALFLDVLLLVFVCF